MTEQLLAQGMEIMPKDFIPADLHDTLIAFTCPAGEYVSFEADVMGTGTIRGASKYKSNHGMRPGTPEDNRFCIFAGPNVPQMEVDFATAVQVAPTMAEIMGVETDWTVEPILKAV